MKKVFYFTFILFNFLFVCNSKANHIAGSDLGYICLGANQYQINLNLYIDCFATSTISTQQTIYFSGPCGSLPSIKVDIVDPNGTEISQLCPSQISSSTCNGGSLPGMRVYRYTGTVTIPTPCNSWTISWSACCRNNAVTNLVIGSNSNSIYLETTLNNSVSACNSSPFFTAQPIPYVCVNQLVNYNFGATDTDKDSLYYSLISAMDANPANYTYTSGYSATSPIPGIVIDPNTGQLTFTPGTIGNFVVVIEVQEYNSNGVLVGSTRRDIQFVVQNCPNTVPDPAGIISEVKNATQTGTNVVEVCEGAAFTFKIKYTDADAGDTLNFISDISTQFPGATITLTGTNPVIATVSWKSPSGSANSKNTFNVTIDDGSCPVPGQQQYAYTIMVLPCIADTSMLFIPNVFTPGGANPEFAIGNYGITVYSIKIFDRWGNRVFQSDDITVHWNGNNVSDGTYYYVIMATGIDKKEYDKKGFVQRIGAK